MDVGRRRQGKRFLGSDHPYQGIHDQTDRKTGNRQQQHHNTDHAHIPAVVVRYSLAHAGNLAVAGAIVGEFLASDKGLGYLMLQVQVTLDTAAMFMAVLLITFIGMLLYGAVVALEGAFVVPDARVS